MQKSKQIALCLSLLVGVFLLPEAQLLAQTQDYEPSEERSDFLARRKSIMAGNRMRATYINTAHAGKWDGGNVDELMFEFPKNTDRQYMYFASMLVGAEVQDQSSDNPEDRFPIVIAPNARQSRQGESWDINPIVGYQRNDTDEMARSDQGPDSRLGNTWPDIWPDKLNDGGDGWAGSWNGYFGRDQFNADVEFYYKAGDDKFTLYNGASRQDQRYQPDATDPSRGGLGLIIDGRILAWSQTLVNSTHFNIYEIKNDASYNYDKVAFGIWIADLVAINAANDIPEFDVLQSIAYLTDSDRTLPPPTVDFGGPIGEMGLKFLETPGNSSDGIDNDGDSDFYNGQGGQAGIYYNASNKDLYGSLLTQNGGFYDLATLTNSVIPVFTEDDFAPRRINEGDKIVLIRDNGDREVTTYVGGTTVRTQGREVLLPEGGMNVVEDLLDEADENFGVHTDLLDNDFDGLIDESTPNHRTKTTFFNGAPITRPVRYINYLYFSEGSIIRRGLIASDGMIEEKMSSDPSFENLVNQANQGRYINIHTAAPMIDEARDDFFDNDQDWIAISDDIGIEGDPDSPSSGIGDGFPSSGQGTSFPGEPNIDKTDVSESDLIGVTRAVIFPSGVLTGYLRNNADISIWEEALLPGDFVVSGALGEDSDIFVTSSLFPLRKGQTERFAIAITAAQTGSINVADDRRVVNQNLQEAQNAYEADYQFATAPITPRVTAIPGDGYVMLYWDDLAEQSFDRYLDRITGQGEDFEGYKVYRTTDDFFELDITDSFGNGQFAQPIAQFDKRNGISGLHPVAINGTQFNLGTDNGIRRVFVDENVINGKQYFYAVTSYDFGAAVAGIAPAESPIQLSRDPDGTFNFGDNVVQVRPAASQAGYIDPLNPVATAVAGNPTGTVSINVVDAQRLIPESSYRLIFEDSVFVSTVETLPDTIKTKNMSLLRVTGGVDTLLNRITNVFNGEDIPEVDGFKLNIQNEDEFGIFDYDPERPRSQGLWENAANDTDLIFPTEVQRVTQRAKLNDYFIVFGELGFGQSSNRRIEFSAGEFIQFPSVPTNFKVFGTYDVDGSEPQEIEYAYRSAPRPLRRNNTFPWPLPEPGIFTTFTHTDSRTGTVSRPSDVIYFIEDYADTTNVSTYRLSMVFTDSTGRVPQAGDTLRIQTNKPFTSRDVLEFKFDADNLPQIDNELAEQELDDVKVVPNPYIVSNPYEPKLNLNNRNQRRELHFTNLPVPCTLRIFTVSGQLVREIDIQEGDNRLFNGTYVWNMLTKDQLEISFGVYIYQIDAPGVGKKIDKFAVIK